MGNARVERMRVDARESGETRRRDIGLTARERYLSNAAMARDAEGARRASVNASGVFNTNGLRCPEDVECERCAAPLNAAPFRAPVNLTGVRVIGCRYRADVCDALREESKACKRHARSLCGEQDTRAQAKTKCKREMNRAWKTRCKEERTMMVSRADGALKRFLEVLENLKRARAKRAAGGAGDDLTMLEMELSRLKTSIGHAFEELRSNHGGVAVGLMSDRMEAFVRGPTLLDSTSDMLDVVNAMNAVLGELQGLSTEAKSLCSYDANTDTSDGKILCQDMEEKMKLSEKRVNRCAARLSDYLASTAKIDALIVEKKRRFALLDSLDKFTDSISGAWSAVQYEGDDDFVEEPSTRFNLTEHVTTGIVHTLMNHYTTVSARHALATAEIKESALCAHIIPRFQLSLLGTGFKRGDLACPPPHGTFIAGRELPDWSAYFLFLLGIAVGAGATIATNRANEAVDFVRTNSSVVVAVLVVVLAGRFF